MNAAVWTTQYSNVDHLFGHTMLRYVVALCKIVRNIINTGSVSPLVCCFNIVLIGNKIYSCQGGGIMSSHGIMTLYGLVRCYFFLL